MGALEYHEISEILSRFEVRLHSDVVAALADAARDRFNDHQSGVVPASLPMASVQPAPHTPPMPPIAAVQPYTWFVEDGSGEPRYAKEPHAIDEPGLVITDLEQWQPLYRHPPVDGE